MSYQERFHSAYHKIHRRSGHIAVAYKGAVVVWGGYMELIPETPLSPSSSEYHNADEIWMYNVYSEIWERIVTKGDLPPRNSGACGVVLGHYLYVFGGYHGENDPGAMDGNSNQLYRLDLDTMTWEWLHPSGTEPCPCDKLVGWEYDHKLYFFGGFGPVPTNFPSVPFQHTLDVSTQSNVWPRGWNNQLVCYNPVFNKWEWPKTRGTPPTPRAAHAADILDNVVYLFGGRYLNQRMNDLHCLDMDSMTWSGNLTKPFEQTPQGRSWHSFTFVSSTRAILYGGLNQYNSVLNDCWYLDIPLGQWRLFDHFDGKPRVWHKAQFLGIGDLLIVGGHRNNILDPIGRRVLQDHAEEMLVLNFTPKTLLKLCLDTVLQHSQTLKEEWHLLPNSLEELLRLRLEQWGV